MRVITVHDADVLLDPRNHEPARLPNLPMAAPRIFKRHHTKYIPTTAGPRV